MISVHKTSQIPASAGISSSVTFGTGGRQVLQVAGHTLGLQEEDQNVDMPSLLPVMAANV